MDLDSRYADAMVRPGMDQASINTQTIPLGEIMGGVDVSNEGGRIPMGGIGIGSGGPRVDNINQFLADAPYMASNVGVRYGLPAAGVTLAGKGLYDMTAMFGNGADYPEEGQLPL